jgi:hypothetical protein
MIVVQVKVIRGIILFSPMEIDSAGHWLTAQWGDLRGQITLTSK